MANRIEDVLFVTYGDLQFQNSKMLLCNEAYNFGFRKFYVGSPESLPSDFLQKHHDFLQNSKRGGGYWLWKPCIVKMCLDYISEGDYLLYADGGCSVNQNGKDRFLEWLNLCDQHGSLSFQMHHLPEKNWTKMSLVNFLGCCDSKYLDTGQINATVFLLKKTKENVELINEWFHICSLEWTIDDTPSDLMNDLSFCEHRHDQSVFSLLRKKRECFTIVDETYPTNTHDWFDPLVRNVPILATRRKF